VVAERTRQPPESSRCAGIQTGEVGYLVTFCPVADQSDTEPAETKPAADAPAQAVAEGGRVMALPMGRP